MKYKFKDIMMAGVFALSAILFAGCDDEPDIKEYVYPEPEVTSYYPSEGYAKSQVTILGKGFGALYEERYNDGTIVPVQAASVSFGGVEAQRILSVNDECIVVEVPENASSGKITLKVWTHKVEVGDFEVWESPVVNKPINAVVRPGGYVIIEGGCLGTSKEEVQVRFGDTMGTITEWSETRIVAVAPEGYATGALTLIVNGLEVSAGAVINPLAKGDVTIAYLKNYKQPFEADADFCKQAGLSGNETGTFLLPAYWTLNDAAKNRTVNGVAVSGLHNNTLILQAATGWDGAGFKKIENGKFYQSTTLPAGKYKLTVDFSECGVADGSLYLMVAKGSVLPDITTISGNADILDYFSGFSRSNTKGEVHELEFELTEESTDVSIGFVATFTSGNNWFRVREIKLVNL